VRRQSAHGSKTQALQNTRHHTEVFLTNQYIHITSTAPPNGGHEATQNNTLEYQVGNTSVRQSPRNESCGGNQLERSLGVSHSIAADIFYIDGLKSEIV
jgi:hypothetical protein